MEDGELVTSAELEESKVEMKKALGLRQVSADLEVVIGLVMEWSSTDGVVCVTVVQHFLRHC
jgi:hypothetical protein